jgi:hypothetical protein
MNSWFSEEDIAISNKRIDRIRITLVFHSVASWLLGCQSGQQHLGRDLRRIPEPFQGVVFEANLFRAMILTPDLPRCELDNRQKAKYLPFRKLQPPKKIKALYIPYHLLPVACFFLAFKSNITFQNGRAVESNSHNYHITQMDETPPIEVQILNTSVKRLGGTGEVGPGHAGVGPWRMQSSPLARF